MLRKFKYLSIASLAAVAFAVTGASAEITPKYLDGTWTLDAAKNCGLKEFEHLTFRSDGTMQGKRFGIVDSIGFWRHDGDFIQLHLLTSPAHFDKRLKDFEGVFGYFPVKVMTFGHQPDQFGAVGNIGDEMEKVSLFRCKK